MSAARAEGATGLGRGGAGGGVVGTGRVRAGRGVSARVRGPKTGPTGVEGGDGLMRCSTRVEERI